MVPFLGTLNTRGRIIIGTQKGTTILTTTHMSYSLNSLKGGYIRGLYRGLRGILGVVHMSYSLNSFLLKGLAGLGFRV